MSPTSLLQIRNPSPLYFGKIAARGDFVRSTGGMKVISLIDRWLSAGMEMLLANPGWKANYDSAASFDFLFASTRKRHAITGALLPSGDSSTRRFPFVAASLFEIDKPLRFMVLSPLLLEAHAERRRALARDAAAAADPTEALAALGQAPGGDFLGTDADARYRNFLLGTSLGALRLTLASGGKVPDLRQMILATGCLLLPILARHAQPPQKAIAFPLPPRGEVHALTEALWLDMVSLFLREAEYDISIFSGLHLGTPRLIVAFNGTTPEVFHALFEEQAAAGSFINVSNSEWVEEYAYADPAIHKLSSYLEHDNLSLQQLLDSFRECFQR